MNENKFTFEQILGALEAHQSGTSLSQIVEDLGIDTNTFYLWKGKYGETGFIQIQRMTKLQEENLKLKQMYADIALENRLLVDMLKRKQ